MEFLDSLIQVKYNWKPYKKWEKDEDDKDFQRQELHKRIKSPKEDLKKADQYGHTVVDAINIMDQYSINKSEDVGTMAGTAKGLVKILGAGIGAGIGALTALTPIGKKIISKNTENRKWLLGVPSFLGYFGANVFGSIMDKFYEKEAARIARYQAREIELKDPRNFVIYNQEQLKKGEQLAKNLSDVPDKNTNNKSLNIITSYGNAIKSIKTLMKDHENYKNWKTNHLKKEETKSNLFENMATKPEQIEKAKKDRDNLLNIVKKIEINSQNYLSNVEMAINSLMAFEFIGGAIGGGLVSAGIWAAQKFGAIKANSSKANAVKKIIPIIAPEIIAIFTTPYFIKLEKEAAKVGRFKTKQELLNDPKSFVTYNDDEKQSVKGLKAHKKSEKGVLGRLKDDIKFFSKFKNDYKEYAEYTKTKGKDELKLREALKQVDVTPEQMKQAESLKKNAFYTFEKMDEKSQRYSDDVEGAANIVKSAATLASVGIGGALVWLMTLKGLIKEGSGKSKIKPEYFVAMIASTLINIPLEILSIQIKKKASKIGLMVAMKDLDDPRNFIDTPF